MDKRFIAVLRDVEDASILSGFLKNIGFSGEVLLTTLNPAFIPVNKTIAHFDNPE